MTGKPEPEERATARAARELAKIQTEIQHAQSVMRGLQRDIADAEGRLSNSQANQLVEANEQLVLSILRAHSDIEEVAQALKTASRSAELDALTELPNRVLMSDRLNCAITSAKRRGSRLALLFLDINNFKQINDTFGHAVGDEVLKAAAQCLASSIREADTVSRHGGDEFLVLINEVSQASDAALIADKLSTALNAPSRVGGHVMHLTASIGISIYPDDGEDARTLVERADASMYRAKRNGRGSYAFHGQQVVGERAALNSHPLVSENHAVNNPDERLAQLREANEKLVLTVLGAQDLQSAAEQSHRRQREFLVTLVHELRNPLAPIRTAAALMSRVEASGLPRLQGVIERQVTHMSRLLGDLFDVSRAVVGKLRLDFEAVNIIDIIDTAVDACQPAIDARHQHFDLVIPRQELELNGDAVRLTQIISNLLDNASKYTPDGGRLGLSADVTSDALVITVYDNGIGIEAESLLHVFDAFVQDPRAVGFNGTGLGIGLTVVRELATAHGGTVTVHSEGQGRGSQFIVTLPLKGTWATDPA
ncbi:MAG: diguanylate cyclase [Rhizobacter sp.]